MTRRPAAAPLLVLRLLACWALAGVPAATSGIAGRRSWHGTVPPFVLVMSAGGNAVRHAIAFADAHLPVDLSANTRTSRAGTLVYACEPRTAGNA